MPERSSELTPREVEVVRLLVDGLTNKEIAARLNLSGRTVHAHLSNAMKRTSTRSRTQLAVLALRRGIVPLDCADREPCDLGISAY
jgi:NarL family two-component system response regulator LiaR